MIATVWYLEKAFLLESNTDNNTSWVDTPILHVVIEFLRMAWSFGSNIVIVVFDIWTFRKINRRPTSPHPNVLISNV